MNIGLDVSVLCGYVMFESVAVDATSLFRFGVHTLKIVLVWFGFAALLSSWLWWGASFFLDWLLWKSCMGYCVVFDVYYMWFFFHHYNSKWVQVELCNCGVSNDVGDMFDLHKQGDTSCFLIVC